MENIWLWVEANQIILISISGGGCLFLLLLLLWQFKKQRDIMYKLKAYETGSLNETLEQAINELRTELKNTKEELEEEKRRLTRFIVKEKKALKKVKLIKYNAFETQGGNVSYALALLNEEDSGVVLNNIHSTDFSFSYAKEVIHGKVSQVLSKEEENVLIKAIGEREKLSTY